MVSKRRKEVQVGTRSIVIVALATWVFYNFILVGIAGLTGDNRAIAAFIAAVIVYFVLGDKLVELVGG